MAQTGFTPILIYSSSTASQAPSASNLTNNTLGSELAINITDGKLFYKDNANAVQVIGWKTVPTSAGGTGLTSFTAGDLMYYATGTTFTKLAIGSAYQQLGVNAGGTAPAWQPSASSVLTAQGDLLYASAANTLARLAKNTTASRYLSNTGTSNNPAWAQIDLTNGVTGTLPAGNGGTGITSFTANGVVYASSTSVLATGTSLVFDGTNFGLGVAAPGYKFDMSAAGVIARFNSTNNANIIALSNASTIGGYIGSNSTNLIFANNAGTEAARIDTNSNFKFNSGYGSVETAYGCRAWISFTTPSGTPTIAKAGNVTSITDNGVGDFTFNFTTSMPDTNYAFVGLGTGGGANYQIAGGAQGNGTTLATGSLRTQFGYVSSVGGVLSNQDPTAAYVAIFR